MFFRNTIMAALVATVALSGINAKAETTAAAPAQSTSSSGSFLDSLKTNGRSSYMMWMTGMNSQAMDGNKDGTGTQLNIQHYFTNGYKLPNNYSVSVGLVFNQAINNTPSESEDKFYLTDPYITFSQSKLYDNEAKGINVSGLIRYYLPTSVQTRNGINDFSAKEQGRGRLMIQVQPSKTFFDGKLTTSVMGRGVYRIAKHNTNERFLNQQQKDPSTGAYLLDSAGNTLKNSATGYNGNHEDFYIVAVPAIAYAVNSKLEVELSWATGLIRHRTEANPAKGQSKWTNLAEKSSDYGQWASVGLNYSPTKKLSVSPYASWGPIYELKNTDIGFIASYSFM